MIINKNWFSNKCVCRSIQEIERFNLRKQIYILENERHTNRPLRGEGKNERTANYFFDNMADFNGQEHHSSGVLRRTGLHVSGTRQFAV